MDMHVDKKTKISIIVIIVAAVIILILDPPLRLTSTRTLLERNINLLYLKVIDIDTGRRFTDEYYDRQREIDDITAELKRRKVIK